MLRLSLLESQTQFALKITAKDFASEKYTDGNIRKIVCAASGRAGLLEADLGT